MRSYPCGSDLKFRFSENIHRANKFFLFFSPGCETACRFFETSSAKYLDDLLYIWACRKSENKTTVVIGGLKPSYLCRFTVHGTEELEHWSILNLDSIVVEAQKGM